MCPRWKRLGPSAWLGITTFYPSRFKIELNEKKKETEKLMNAVRRMKNLKTLKIKKTYYSYRRKKIEEIYSQILQNISQELDEIDIRPDSFSSNTMSITLVSI